MNEALEDMIFQFGYRTIIDGQPAITSGGLSALESAFKALGWDDPYIIPEEGNTCEILGCMNEPVTGQKWDDMYLRLCSTHYHMERMNRERPPVKDYAIKRESRRNKKTGILDDDET